MNLERLLFRSWFYLRIGYATYIAFLIGFLGNIIVIYKLAVADTQLLSVFPRLTTFTIVTVLVSAPISIAIGLFHMRRTGAYAADATVSTESNPYVYRVVPGKEQEVFLPLWILTAKALLSSTETRLTIDERQELERALAKADKLIAGQPVGNIRFVRG